MTPDRSSPQDSLPVRIVTVSREFGSGGSDLAHALGDLLAWRVVDKEVVRRVARELSIPEQEAELLDEHVPGLAERIGAFLAGSFAEVVLPPEPPIRNAEKRVSSTVETIFKEVVAAGPAILVGHGGMGLFADRAEALHVRVVAPLEHRVREVRRRLGRTEDEAREEIRASDSDREHYIRHRFELAWDDASLYAAVLNSAVVGPEEGADFLARLIRARER